MFCCLNLIYYLLLIKIHNILILKSLIFCVRLPIQISYKNEYHIILNLIYNEDFMQHLYHYP